MKPKSEKTPADYSFIELSGYKTELVDGVVTYYAVPKDKSIEPIEMADCFKEMYNDSYLAVKLVKGSDHGETISEDLTSDYHIPLRTSDD